MEQGCSVELVDPDLRSLWRAVRSGGQVDQGALDVHWATGARLPPLAPVDLAIAVEVLCYVPDPAAVVAEVAGVLAPGGHLLCSVEADLGWSMATDAAPGSLDALFRDDGVVHVPGDRWVQTYSGDRLQRLLEPHFEVLELVPTHYALSGPFEQAAGPLHIDEALALEDRLAADPRTRHLHRAWAAVARRR
jgi:SAM-dependent methyltransferase